MSATRPTDDSATPGSADASAREPLLRPEDAARLLSVRPNWIYEAVRARRMPCIRIGRHIRFTRRMLDQWLADNTDA